MRRDVAQLILFYLCQVSAKRETKKDAFMVRHMRARRAAARCCCCRCCCAECISPPTPKCIFSFRFRRYKNCHTHRHTTHQLRTKGKHPRVFHMRAKQPQNMPAKKSSPSTESASNQRTQIKAALPPAKYKCPVKSCDKCFTYRSSLNRHCAIAHGICQ